MPKATQSISQKTNQTTSHQQLTVPQKCYDPGNPGGRDLTGRELIQAWGGRDLILSRISIFTV